MILLREIQEKDLEALERFAQIPGFINLPNDRDLLKEKILKSIASFRDPSANKFDGKYMFVAEDVETRKVLGTSMIAGQHGTTESPHFYFEVGSEEKYSETISTGFIHGTLKLKYDTNGPSEIGGLVIDPEYRNSDVRIGRQISFVRFLFLGLNRQKFKRKLLAELLPPLNRKGQSPLWEAIGRRFTNMDYWEADQLCQKNKEFIFSLFPSGKIYTTFLAAEAKNSIGKVGKETEPVLHMLKKIGFEYKNHVDPFDGGPHLWANVDDVLPIRKIKTLSLGAQPDQPKSSHPSESGLLCRKSQRVGEFKAVAVKGIISQDQFYLLEPQYTELKAVLGLSPGDSLIFMPYY
ncbi:arginine N-succinyltransferase [bacterium]|jgi:arginine N-succinyltransferase|nr:arginine N-succinyltransferase [bacterium]